MALLFIILLSAGLGVITFAIWYALSGPKGTSDVARRLQSVEKKQGRRPAAEAEMQILRDETLSTVPALNRILGRWSGVSRFQEFLSRSGVRTNLGKVILWSATLGVAGYLAALRFGLRVYFAIPAAIVTGLIPMGFLSFKFSRRLHAFEKAFPDALDLLARAVRAGHAFTTGLEMVSKELPEPVAEAFYKVAREALANVEKHAGALNVWIELSIEPAPIPLDGQWARLVVRDDGRGFRRPWLAQPGEPDEDERGQMHFGMSNMRRAAEAVGGQLDVETAPGRGTTIVARVPLP